MSEAVAKASEVATTAFRKGFNCAESVLMGLTEAFGLPAVPTVATGFGGGIGRYGDACGAVTGGVMAIGLKANRTSPDQKDLYDAVHAAVRRFMDEFIRAEGGIYCRDLTGYDLRIPEQYAKFHSDKQRREKCLKLVDTAARLAAEVIESACLP
ncbi:MAG: C_GCAxxG_C_C family protein [Firmicutes bacterium]|nr:C_GCAxxG_C_C family protein [Bacillota bacterium]